MNSTALAAVLATVGAAAAVGAVLAVGALTAPGAVTVPVPATPLSAGEPGPAALARACGSLAAALPARLGELDRRDTSPASVATAAYGDPAVVLRCGVAAAAGFTLGVEPFGVDEVFWFSDDRGAEVVWTTVDRSIRLEVTIPATIADQGALLVDLAPAVTGALPKTPISPLPPPG